MAGEVAVLNINGAAVWDAILEEGALTMLLHDGTRQVMLGFMETELPEALDGLARLPATGGNIAAATVAFARRLLNKGVLSDLAAAIAKGTRPSFSADELYDRLVESAEEAIDQRVEKAAGYEDYLASQGMTDEQELRRLGMDADNIRRVQSGELTIGKLLLAQPSVVLDLSTQ